MTVAKTMHNGADHQDRPRVLVTGANGLIGGFLMDSWRAPGSRFEPVGPARQPGPNADIVADIADIAATSAVDSAWEAVRDSNLIGTYNVFEAARRAGVPEVVFASSNHAIGTYELEGVPALYHTAELRLDSLYGVSKVHGEAMGRPEQLLAGNLGPAPPHARRPAQRARLPTGD